MSTENIKKAAKILSDAKEKSLAIIGHGELGHIGLMLESNLDKIINRLHFLSGTDFNASSPQDFPPITEFMGEKITLEKLDDVDIDPTEEEKRAFLAKVDALTVVLLAPEVDIEAVLHNNSLPEDQLVIRAVAKRVGVEGYDTDTVDVLFLEDVIEALKAKQLQEDAEKQAETILASGNLIQSSAEVKTFDHDLSKDDVGNNPAGTSTTELAQKEEKVKAKAGEKKRTLE